jgi:hypothetical protein
MARPRAVPNVRKVHSFGSDSELEQGGETGRDGFMKTEERVLVNCDVIIYIKH